MAMFLSYWQLFPEFELFYYYYFILFFLFRSLEALALPWAAPQPGNSDKFHAYGKSHLVMYTLQSQ